MEDRRLERIEKKVDDLAEHLSSIDTTLALQHEQLKQHIKRSDLLEKKLAPVEKHVSIVNGIMKLFGAVSIVTSAILGVLHIIKVI